MLLVPYLLPATYQRTVCLSNSGFFFFLEWKNKKWYKNRNENEEEKCKGLVKAAKSMNKWRTQRKGLATRVGRSLGRLAHEKLSVIKVSKYDKLN